MGELRRAYPTEQIDLHSMVPDPKEMGQLYIDLRENEFKDGMTMACAIPRELPYDQIVELYTKERRNKGFSPSSFWHEHFETPDLQAEDYRAPEGTDIYDYVHKMREQFVQPSDTSKGFDIWLPYPRTTASAGRFGRHSYLWDNFHIAQGYKVDGDWDGILDIVDNTEYQINRFGRALNANLLIYDREHPPYFSSMVEMLTERYGDEALIRYLPAMEKDYSYWMRGEDALAARPDDGKVHGHASLLRVPLGGGRFAYVNRYWDNSDGPRLESYLEDVTLASTVAKGLTGAQRERRMQEVYKHARVVGASGWDISSRYLEDGHNLETLNTADIAPIDLNCLLARTEQIIAKAHMAAGNPAKALEYQNRYVERVRAINILMRNSKTRTYHDYNFVTGKQTDIISAAAAYPLYIGMTNKEETAGIADMIEEQLLYPGGIVATTSTLSIQQWDGGKDGKGMMNVWAPPNWVCARGLARAAISFAEQGAFADRMATLSKMVIENYTYGIKQVYKTHRIIPEKHRGDRPTQLGTGGEYEVEKALAMAVEVFYALAHQADTLKSPSPELLLGALATAA